MTHRVIVLAPAALVAQEVIAFHQRRGKPKAGIDWRDIAMLLLTFPDLKVDLGPVTEPQIEAKTSPEIMFAWQDLVQQEIQPVEEDDDF